MGAPEQSHGELPPEQFLFGRNEPIDWTRGNFLRHGIDVWWRETFLRQRHLWPVAKGLFNSRDPLGYVLEGFDLAGQLDLSNRAANGLRLSLLVDRNKPDQLSNFGSQLYQAQNHPTLTHGHEHSRPTEYWLRAYVKNISELRHAPGVYELVPAGFLFPYFHDTAEVLREYHNIRKEDSQIPIKPGHELEGALILQAIYKRYAEERGIRDDEAQRLCALGAGIILGHAHPDKFVQRREAAMVPSNFQNPKFLLHGWEAGEINPLSLTPAQQTLMHKEIKGSMKLVNARSPYGYHPDFYKEYQDEIERIANDHQPAASWLKPEEWEPFWLVNEACVRADTMAMVTPYWESLLRTFLVRDYWGRPLWRPEIGKAEFVRSVVEGPGNVEMGIDSLVRRKLWEFFHVFDIDPESMIGKSAYVKNINEENLMLGILGFRKLMEGLLRGDVSDIDTMYARRVQGLRDKALRRSGFGALQRLWVASAVPHLYALQGKGSEAYAQYLDHLIRIGDFDETRLELKIQNLEEERQDVINSLRTESFTSGRMANDEGIPVYSEDERMACLAVIDHCVELLRERYGISLRKLQYYQNLVNDWVVPPSQPYRQPDSLGSIPKTLREPAPLVQEVLLKGMAFQPA